MSLLEYYGKRVAEWRKAAGLTQPQLGERVGKTKQTITALETASQGTSFEVMDNISKAVDVPVAGFFPTYILGRDITERDEKIDRIIAGAMRLPDKHVDTVLEIIQCLSDPTDTR